LDNTLVDTDPMIRRALERCGCSQASEISESDLHSFSPNELLKRAGRADAAGRYWQLYGALAKGESKLLDPKTPAVLSELQARSVKLGLVTSSPKSVTAAMLSTCGIAEQFASCMVTYGTCNRRKPFPDPILAALKLLRHPAARAIYIGDAPKDADASRAAGTHFGFAGWARVPKEEMDALKPDRMFAEIADILSCT
jgi:HAD superfamily hydrolase (TIGR01509 family)